MADELPPVVTRLTADIQGLADGLVKGKALVQEFKSAVASEFGGGLPIGQRLGSDIGDGVGRGIQDAKPGIEAGGEDLGKGLGDGLSKGIEPGLAQVDRKVTDQAKKTGEKAGQAAANGISPLLISAFAGAAVVGPAALLAGTSAAVLGVGALLSRSNADIQAEYKTLASDVGRDLQDAVSPLAPAIQASMVQADAAAQKLAPVLKNTFADAEPDLTAFTQGVTGLATNALPGIRDAIDQSRGIVTGFAGSLPTLGSGVGRFFTGLTTNAQSTQSGIVDFVDVASNALATLGHVAGSASAALSADFAAVTPILNTTLGVIDKLASPPVIGGLLGVGAALKFDPGISGGLQKISNGLTSVAAKADGSTGLLGKAGGAAESAAGGFGKMADIMGGPWGVAVGAGIGLLGGLVSNLTQGVASVSDFTAAVAQDNGVVGASTTATIQKKLATLDLKTAQDDLGVSQTTLIEYAGQDASAQKIVQDAYTKKVAALKASGEVSGQNTAATVQGNIAAKAEADRLRDVIGQVDDVTAAVKGALEQQNAQNQAYLAATRSAGIFAGMVDTATTALQTHANQSAINTVASLQLGAGQTQLGQSLSNILYNYQLAATGAQGYNAVMSALNGTTTSLTDAQNNLDQALLNAKTQFKANSYSLDENTQAGINDRDALSAASKEIIAMGVAQYQTTGSMSKANDLVQQQIDAYVKATGATGKAKQAIEDYLNKITQIPPGVATNVTANTGPADAALQGFLTRVDSAQGFVTVNLVPGHTSGGRTYTSNAGGGPVQEGELSLVGEEGPELVQFGASGRVIPNDQIAPYLAAMRSGNPGLGAGVGVGGAGSPASGAGGTGGGLGVNVVPVAVNVYIDSKKLGGGLNAGVRADVQQFARHNALTGYASNYR